MDSPTRPGPDLHPGFMLMCRQLEEQEVRETFDAHWSQQERLGNCDALGGAQYERVYREWVDDGCDRLVGLFIYHSCNRI